MLLDMLLICTLDEKYYNEAFDFAFKVKCPTFLSKTFAPIKLAFLIDFVLDAAM